MELIILGSGTGVPSLKRGSPAALIKAGGKSLLLDSGSGAMNKMLKAGVTYKDLDIILYSHIHPDHVADLVPLIFACKYKEDPREKDLFIIGGRGFQDYFEGLRWVYGGWVEPETFRIHIKEVLADDMDLGDIRITTLPLEHTPESVGYRIESPQGMTLTYSGDTDYCRNIVELARGADLLLLEASFPEGMKVKGHLTPSLAGRIAHEAGCKRLILTHFYPLCDQSDIKGDCQRIYQGEVILAYDMMRIEV
ncbi:MAG: MBL fold metallo-hydrolase [Deltaproteobacteria bacterium]|nr:MBL fold metallo-hydrolase [Deltaproteobacteria bacterium]